LSGQASTSSLLRYLNLLACHSEAALKPAKQGDSFNELLAFMI
jgi:hypothetical protein